MADAAPVEVEEATAAEVLDADGFRVTLAEVDRVVAAEEVAADAAVVVAAAVASLALRVPHWASSLHFFWPSRSLGWLATH